MSIINWIKGNKIKSFFLVLFSPLILAILYTLCSYPYYFYETIEPFKITNVNNPKFNPEKFEFDDYELKSDKELSEIMCQLFPIGTSKDYIDRILINNAGATVKSYSTETREGQKSVYRQLSSAYIDSGSKGKNRSQDRLNLLNQLGDSVYIYSKSKLGRTISIIRHPFDFGYRFPMQFDDQNKLEKHYYNYGFHPIECDQYIK